MSLPAELSRHVRTTALRIRLQRGLNAAVVLAIAGLGLAAFVVALMKTDALGEARAIPWLAAAAALPLLGALAGLARPVRPLLAAKLLDRAHGLEDRVTNAVSFAALPSSERTPFMDAAIDDARAHSKILRATRAMPLRAPDGVVPMLGLGVGVALLAFLEVPRFVEEHAMSGGIVPVLLHEDDLDAFDSGLRDLIDDPETPDDVRGAAREFNRLIEDLADERLDRAETLRRIAELERRLSEARPADPDLMRDSLAQLGRDLERASLADELSSALRDADAARAEAEMRRLAERLRSEEPNRAELERLRQALSRAAENQPEDLRDEIRQQEEEVNRLLQRQREKQGATPQERRLLQRRQRELERLRREHQESAERQRQLDRLQRELSQAAEQLGQQQQDQAAQDLDQGAQDLNRMAREQMSDEEMQRMQQQLAELRELIRQSRQQQQQAQNGQGQRGQGGQGQQGQSRMDRFVLRARGQGEGEGMPIGTPGQGGQEQQGGQQGQQGQQQGQGQGGDGQGQGEGQQQLLVLGGQGGGDAVLEIPGMGQQQGQGQQGTGPARQGPGAGVGHDPTMLDDPTHLGGSRQTVRVEGQQGEGPTRSEVIRSSAQRGFASRDYRDVYTDYSGHAEEVLEQDEVPPGYRSYVRRYFQLIRPRDE
jgi:hypothetical protein